jgi:hypothetical protein
MRSEEASRNTGGDDELVNASGCGRAIDRSTAITPAIVAGNTETIGLAGGAGLLASTAGVVSDEFVQQLTVWVDGAQSRSAMQHAMASLSCVRCIIRQFATPDNASAVTTHEMVNRRANQSIESIVRTIVPLVKHR